MSDVEVPLLFQVDEWVAWADERDELVRFEEFDVMRGRVGRVWGPSLLWQLEMEGLLGEGALSAAIGSVWGMAEYPERALGRDAWRQLFADAGYTEDGQPKARPAAALRLWRGSESAYRDGWAWTDNLEMAERYASGEWYYRPAGQVWTALVDPWRLLAKITERNEHEYVVDTAGLLVSQW